MATVGFGVNALQTATTPRSDVNTQKSAKEQALAYENNLVNGAYIEQAQTAAYGNPVSYRDTAFGKVPVFDATIPKYLGITPAMQQYGFVPVNRPAMPANNAPEQAWSDYLNQAQKAIRTPLYADGSQYQLFQNLDRNQIKTLQSQFQKSGLYAKGTIVTPGVPSTTDYDIAAKMMGQANITGTTWEDMLNKNAVAFQKSGGMGGGSSTSTQISYSQTSIANGRNLLQKTLGTAIGRNPTDVELKRYMKMLHEAESNSPTRTVTTNSGGTSVTRTTPTEVDASNLALEFAKEIGGGDPYRERQAGRYLNLIVNRAGVSYA